MFVRTPDAAIGVASAEAGRDIPGIMQVFKRKGNCEPMGGRNKEKSEGPT